MRSALSFAIVVVLFLALGAAACAGPSGKESEHVGLSAEPMLPRRDGAVLVDGCVLDTWQRSTLASPSAKRVLGEVIMLCLVPRLDGTVGPRDPSALAALFALAADVKREGYRFHLGVAFTDESGQRYDGQQTRGFLGDAAWRHVFESSLAGALGNADGVAIDLQELPNDAEPFVTALFAELSPVVRPARRLDVFVPPSVTAPSDLPGGDAFATAKLGSYVDRMRVMTLDYSDAKAGPTIDPGWAVDAARFAKSRFAKVDIAYPLYGTDFGPRGHRSVTFHEARAVADLAAVRVDRGPTGAPFIHYLAFGEEQHELWFDDAESTGRALGAWTFDVLPPDVGVLFYGLGAEDPSLFDRLAARLP
jgi:hypothetical protein